MAESASGRDGMIESLPVLMARRKTAVSAMRIALRMIRNTIVCAPGGLRDQLASLTFGSRRVLRSRTAVVDATRAALKSATDSGRLLWPTSEKKCDGTPNRIAQDAPAVDERAAQRWARPAFSSRFANSR